MSKFVKSLVAEHYAERFEGVREALLVNVVGLEANKTVELRKNLREKNIQLMVVKNSLAKRATEGTPLASAFEIAEGALAIIWGSEDIISLAKEVARLHADSEFKAFQAKGGVMDGEPLTAEGVQEISKWPTREEQLSILMGQILSPWTSLSSQLVAPGSALASQIEKKAEGDES